LVKAALIFVINHSTGFSNELRPDETLSFIVFYTYQQQVAGKRLFEN
jgi:hypothetical protein